MKRSEDKGSLTLVLKEMVTDDFPRNIEADERDMRSDREDSG